MRSVFREAKLVRQRSPQLLNESREISVLGRNRGQLIRIEERGLQIPSRATERDQCRQDVAIPRVMRQTLFQPRDSLLALTTRVERDGVHIDVSRAVRVKLDGLPKLGKCRVRPLES